MNRLLPPMLCAVFSAAHLQAAAASFDCHSRPLAAVEARICSTPALSALDDQLADAYRRAHAATPGVAVDERRWMRQVRDRCLSDACLADAYKARIEALSRRKDKDATCPLAEKALMGDWLNTGRESQELDEIRLVEYQGVRNFVSYLHQAALAAGSWTLQDCRIHVKGAAEGIDFDFDILAFDRDVVRLKNVDDDTVLEFRKKAAR
jgi:uncharacterized protein